MYGQGGNYSSRPPSQHRLPGPPPPPPPVYQHGPASGHPNAGQGNLNNSLPPPPGPPPPLQLPQQSQWSQNVHQTSQGQAMFRGQAPPGGIQVLPPPPPPLPPSSSLASYSIPPPPPANIIGQSLDSQTNSDSVDRVIAGNQSSDNLTALSNHSDHGGATDSLVQPSSLINAGIYNSLSDSDMDMDMEDDITFPDGEEQSFLYNTPNHGSVPISNEQNMEQLLQVSGDAAKHSPDEDEDNMACSVSSGLGEQDQGPTVCRNDDEFSPKLDFHSMPSELSSEKPKGNSPYRLVQDYASDDSSEFDHQKHIDSAAVEAGISSVGPEKGFDQVLKSSESPKVSLKSPRVDDKNVKVVPKSNSQGGSRSGKLEKEGESALKVDEYGRLVRENESEYDSGDSPRYNRRQRGRRERSRSPPIRRRSRSRSRSPYNNRSRQRSPRRRRERHGRSRSQSPKRHRSRSRSNSPSSYRRVADLFGTRDKFPPPTCFDFSRGNCYRGASCKYRHHESDKPDNNNYNYNKSTSSSRTKYQHEEEIKDGSQQSVEETHLKTPPHQAEKTPDVKDSETQQMNDPILQNQDSNAGTFSSHLPLPLPSLSQDNLSASKYPHQFPVPSSTTSWNPLPPPPPPPPPYPYVGGQYGFPPPQFQQNLYDTSSVRPYGPAFEEETYPPGQEPYRSSYRPNDFGPRMSNPNGEDGFIGQRMYFQDHSTQPSYGLLPTPMGGSRISNHFNPYASTFDQPLSSKFTSNILPQENDNNDGLLPKPVNNQYDPLHDSLERSSNSVKKPEGNDEYGETADAEVGAVENGSAGNPEVADDDDVASGEVKEPGKTKSIKDSKSMKRFKVAIADFVKEVLKPSWRQGNMSKEAFKTIVKKTVDKVSAAIKTHQVPKSQAKIDHYIASAQSKLTKLVMGYVDKYVKA